MRGVAWIILPLLALSSCIRTPDRPGADREYPPFTSQEEIERIATDAAKEWGGCNSAAVCDVLRCLLDQKLSKEGFPASPGRNYRLVNSVDADASVHLMRPDGDSRMLLCHPDGDVRLPLECTAEVFVMSTAVGDARLTVIGNEVFLEASGLDGSVTTYRSKEDVVSVKALLPDGSRFLELSGDGEESVIDVRDDVRIEISGGSLSGFSDDVRELRSRAGSADVDMALESFNDKYGISVLLRGEVVGRARAEQFMDETGADVDLVIHYDTDNVACSVPHVIFDRVLDLPRLREE